MSINKSANVLKDAPKGFLSLIYFFFYRNTGIQFPIKSSSKWVVHSNSLSRFNIKVGDNKSDVFF